MAHQASSGPGPDVPGTPTEDNLLFMCIYCLFIDSEVQQRPYPDLPSDLGPVPSCRLLVSGLERSGRPLSGRIIPGDSF